MKAIALSILLLLGGCATHGNLTGSASTSQDKDSQEIFRAVLQGWLDRNEERGNSTYVAKSTFSLPEREVKEMTACANSGAATSVTLTLEPVARISGAISSPRLYFINRRLWVMPDPKQLIAIIAEGRPAGIISLSSVAFNQDKSVAALQFSHLCGPLCGYYETLVLDKTASGWVQRPETCDRWMS